MRRARSNASTSNLGRHIERCLGLQDNIEAPPMEYSVEGVRYTLCEWVSASNRPFSIVDDPGFRALPFHLCQSTLTYSQGTYSKTLRPDVKIPSASTVASDVKRNLELTEEHLKTFFSARILLTYLVSSTKPTSRLCQASFTSVSTAGPPQTLYHLLGLFYSFMMARTCAESFSILFRTSSRILYNIESNQVYHSMTSAHTGENLAAEVAKCLQKFDIEERVSGFMLRLLKYNLHDISRF